MHRCSRNRDTYTHRPHTKNTDLKISRVHTCFLRLFSYRRAYNKTTRRALVAMRGFVCASSRIFSTIRTCSACLSALARSCSVADTAMSSVSQVGQREREALYLTNKSGPSVDTDPERTLTVGLDVFGQNANHRYMFGHAVGFSLELGIVFDKILHILCIAMTFACRSVAKSFPLP